MHAMNTLFAALVTSGLAIGASTASASLLVNGDLEIAGFSDPGTATITPSGQAGGGWQEGADNREWTTSTSNAIDGTDGQVATNGRPRNMGQIITDSSAGAFTFSFDWKLEAEPDGRTNFKGFAYGVFVTSNSNAELNIDGQSTLAGSGWAQVAGGSFTESFGGQPIADKTGTVTESLTLDGTQQWAGVVIRALASDIPGDYGSNIAWHVDNVTLEAAPAPAAVPEPSVLALLALGGTVMLGRRKRRV